MSSVQSILMQDPCFIEERRKQCQRTKEVFTKQLAHIFSIMPAPKRGFDSRTGEWTVVNDPQWQALIDHIVETGNQYLQKEFPELNQPTTTT